MNPPGRQVDKHRPDWHWKRRKKQPKEKHQPIRPHPCPSSNQASKPELLSFGKPKKKHTRKKPFIPSSSSIQLRLNNCGWSVFAFVETTPQLVLLFSSHRVYFYLKAFGICPLGSSTPRSFFDKEMACCRPFGSLQMVSASVNGYRYLWAYIETALLLWNVRAGTANRIDDESVGDASRCWCALTTGSPALPSEDVPRRTEDDPTPLLRRPYLNIAERLVYSRQSRSFLTDFLSIVPKRTPFKQISHCGKAWRKKLCEECSTTRSRWRGGRQFGKWKWDIYAAELIPSLAPANPFRMTWGMFRVSYFVVFWFFFPEIYFCVYARLWQLL